MTEPLGVQVDRLAARMAREMAGMGRGGRGRRFGDGRSGGAGAGASFASGALRGAGYGGVEYDQPDPSRAESWVVGSGAVGQGYAGVEYDQPDPAQAGQSVREREWRSEYDDDMREPTLPRKGAPGPGSVLSRNADDSPIFGPPAPGWVYNPDARPQAQGVSSNTPVWRPEEDQWTLAPVEREYWRGVINDPTLPAFARQSMIRSLTAQQRHELGLSAPVHALEAMETATSGEMLYGLYHTLLVADEFLGAELHWSPQALLIPSNASCQANKRWSDW